MTLSDYLKVFRHRWPVVVACMVSAAVIMWVVTPAQTATAQKASSYTTTATLLVGGSNGAGVDSTAQMGRIALYLTTGEIPRRAAAKLGYDGDPAVLASGLTVTPDFTAGALTVKSTSADGERAAAVANAFADETVAFFKSSRPGTGKADVTILQRATPIPVVTGGGFVVPPGRTFRTLLAAGLGLLLGLALALVIERLDSRMRTRDEIAAALKLPIIAEVPRLNRAQRRNPAIGVAQHPLSPYADAYRAARTALAHSTEHHAGPSAVVAPEPSRAHSAGGGRLLLVTSAQPAEGKTTSVANLAASFAETGQQVLVLDADLRSPDTHTLFDVPQGAGISDYLSQPDGASLSALTRPTSVSGVRIITAGTRLAHPASLASRMGGLLEEARGLADVVLIDTAPLLAASDVFDLLPHVDTVLIVVRNGRITEVDGQRVSELLGRFNVPVSGVLIVGSRSDSGRYGYSYGYGYGAGKKKGRRRAPRSRPSLPSLPSRRPAEPNEELEPDSRRARRAASSL